MIRPKQRVSEAEKTPEWYRLSARYYSSVCMPLVDNRKVDILYRAANGEFDEKDYLYVTNPLNTNVEKYKRFPSKIRNFDIISPVVMLLMGEKRRRGLTYSVVARNSNIQTQRAEMEKELVDQMLIQQIMNEVIAFSQAQGQQVDIPQVQQITTQKIKEKTSTLQDEVATMGQGALDYIRDYNNLDSKFVENWFHFICTGRAASFKEPFRDEVIYEPVSGKEIKHLSHSRVRNLEDSEAITRFVRMPVTELIDKFQGVDGFDSDMIKELETKYGYDNEGFSKGGTVLQGKTEIDSAEIRASSALWNTINNNGERTIYSDADGIQVEHVVWTAMVEIGTLTGTNIFGEIYEEQVDRDFKPVKGEKIVWSWVKQKEHAYIVDDRFVVGGQSLLHTRADVSKPDACKNPYNGKILNMRHVNPMSVVEKGIPYQIKYNIIHYYIEKTMAKNMDKIIIFPLGLIANDRGHTTESTMYYSQANGFLFVDETNKNFQTALNGVKVLDASLTQHIDKLYQYLQIIKAEWESIIGITPARKGQMANSNDGKALMENSVFRSSVMTEEYFAQIEELEQSELQGLMEISKYAFSEGKKAMFLDTDLRKVLVDIDPAKFSYADYLIRVSNSGHDLEQLERAKATAQAIAQNSEGRFTPMLRVLRSNNISQLIEEMDKNERELMQIQQQQQQQALAATKQISDDKIAQEDKELQYKYYKTDKDNETKVIVEEMSGEVSLRQEKFNTENSDSDVESFLEHNLEREKQNKEFSIRERELSADERMNTEDNDTKKYVADKQVRVASVNK